MAAKAKEPTASFGAFSLKVSPKMISHSAGWMARADPSAGPVRAVLR